MTVATNVKLSAYEQRREPAAAPIHLGIAGLSKRFGSVMALEDIRLDVPRGSFTTLLGPSGCGKTTLLRLIAGFYEPDDGAISLNGTRIDQLPAHRRGTAMVFQDYALFPHMNVYDNVAYGLRLARLPKDEVKKRMAQTLAFVGLAALAGRWPNQLSGGQQQRVALARALVIQPEVLLLDEPLSNLDASLREQLRWELRALQQQLGITFIYVTHDQSEALAMSDWIAVMNSGHVEQWGTPVDIYHHPQTAFMARFVGSANLRHARVLAIENNEWVVAFTDSRQQFRLPASSAHALSLSPGEDILTCIRPESIRINPDEIAAGDILLQGRVVRRAFLGAIVRYWITCDEDEWIVDQSDPGIAGTHSGEVMLSIRPDRVHAIRLAQNGLRS